MASMSKSAVASCDVAIEAVYLDGKLLVARVEGDGESRFLEFYDREGDGFRRVAYRPRGVSEKSGIVPDAGSPGYLRALLSDETPEVVEERFGIPVSAEKWFTLDEGWFTVDDTERYCTRRDLDRSIGAIKK